MILERAPVTAPDQIRLRHWVEELAVPRHHRTNPRGNARVCQRTADALEHCGLAVELQGPYRNVVAMPPGTDAPLTLVAAHYDSVPDCPGADDNASGVAVMLECARVLAGGRPRAVGFLAFNAEEDNLLGSRDFVANALPQLGREVRSVQVLEMVGYRGQSQQTPLPWTPPTLRTADFLALVSSGRSNPIADAAIACPAAPGLRVVAMKTWPPLVRLFPDLARSDHAPFWAAGLPAVLWTDTANFRNPHYHRPTDTPETLDYGFMREVAELLCAVVASDSPSG